jgi:hypothetical protein
LEPPDRHGISDGLMENRGGAALPCCRNTAETGVDANHAEFPLLQLFGKGAIAAAKIQNLR